MEESVKINRAHEILGHPGVSALSHQAEALRFEIDLFVDSLFREIPALTSNRCELILPLKTPRGEVLGFHAN